jgi:signal transduction histidine kinase
MALDRQPISIKELLGRVINQMELQFQRRKIAIKTNFDDDLPLVNVDERKIEQVAVNLLSNALKFAKPDTSVIVSAERMSATPHEGRALVRVSISDMGLGIPAQEMPMLFERYKQVSTASKIKQKGTGLGLAICKLIVEAHEGTISAESEPNQWTTFRFTLPVVQD